MKQNRPPPELIEKVRKMLREQEHKKRDFIEKHGYVRPPNVIKIPGNKTVSVLDGAIYVQTVEETYNFGNVIHDHMLIFFGQTFIDNEEKKPIEQRHPAIQWLFQIGESETGNQPKKLGIEAAWYRLAHDLYTIRENAKLEAHLKTRLMNPLSFQGARHELRVAAICVAAGFDLEFQDESDVTTTHPEFIAKDRFSANKIAIEAKSRHRHGVLGFTEGTNEALGSSVKVRGLVTKAYKKVSEVPFYVFVDVNLPPCKDEEQYSNWHSEIEETMMALAVDGYTNPCPANAIFFCNDPSHYITDRFLQAHTDQLWIKHFEAEVPKVAHPSENIVGRLMKAFTQRVSSPDEIDFQK